MLVLQSLRLKSLSCTISRNALQEVAAAKKWINESLTFDIQVGQSG